MQAEAQSDLTPHRRVFGSHLSYAANLTVYYSTHEYISLGARFWYDGRSICLCMLLRIYWRLLCCWWGTIAKRFLVGGV